MKSLFGQRISEKGLEFIVDIPDDFPKSALLDEIRLRQVLINLIGNSIKFTHSGSIRISVDYRYTDRKFRSTMDLVFQVEDTGIGIPREEQEVIFNAFSQVREQKVSRDEGTGLGLAISKRLIEMMNGEIRMQSEKDKGSIFTIILYDVEIPATTVHSEKTGTELDPDTIVFNKCTILIADDIEYNRVLLKGYMENQNFEIIEAENGLQAIESAKKSPPDIILLDMKMPVMTGYEASETIKKDDEISDIPIIAITASALKEDVERILKTCNAFLSKPVSKTDLFNMLKAYLPYSTKTRKTIKSTRAADMPHTIHLSDLNLKDYPELLKKLVLKKEECRKLAAQMPMDKVEAFALELREMGEEHGFNELVNFGDVLYNYSMSLEIEEIKRCLSELETVIDKIGNTR